jgi:hypothetical protein
VRTSAYLYGKLLPNNFFLKRYLSFLSTKITFSSRNYTKYGENMTPLKLQKLEPYLKEVNLASSLG